MVICYADMILYNGAALSCWSYGSYGSLRVVLVVYTSAIK